MFTLRLEFQFKFDQNIEKGRGFNRVIYICLEID